MSDSTKFCSIIDESGHYQVSSFLSLTITTIILISLYSQMKLGLFEFSKYNFLTKYSLFSSIMVACGIIGLLLTSLYIHLEFDACESSMNSIPILQQWIPVLSVSTSITHSIWIINMLCSLIIYMFLYVYNIQYRNINQLFYGYINIEPRKEYKPILKFFNINFKNTFFNIITLLLTIGIVSVYSTFYNIGTMNNTAVSGGGNCACIDSYIWDITYLFAVLLFGVLFIRISSKYSNIFAIIIYDLGILFIIVASLSLAYERINSIFVNTPNNIYKYLRVEYLLYLLILIQYLILITMKSNDTITDGTVSIDSKYKDNTVQDPTQSIKSIEILAEDDRDVFNIQSPKAKKNNKNISKDNNNDMIRKSSQIRFVSENKNAELQASEVLRSQRLKSLPIPTFGNLDLRKVESNSQIEDSTSASSWSPKSNQINLLRHPSNPIADNIDNAIDIIYDRDVKLGKINNHYND